MPASLKRILRVAALCHSGLLRSTASVLLLGFAAYSDAAVIRGTFSGIAVRSRINAEAPWASNFDGQTVTGSFFFDPYDQGKNPDYPGEEWPVVRPGSLELVFYAAGQRVVFNTLDGQLGLVFYSTAADHQYLAVTASLYPYWSASLGLSGPLFADDRLESLHVAPIDLTHSGATFFAGRSFGADVRLTRVSFDGVSVPEPPVLALEAGGLTLLALISRRRRNR